MAEKMLVTQALDERDLLVKRSRTRSGRQSSWTRRSGTRSEPQESA